MDGSVVDYCSDCSCSRGTHFESTLGLQFLVNSNLGRSLVGHFPRWFGASPVTKKIMCAMGLEPMRISPRELESRSLTTRTHALDVFHGKSMYNDMHRKTNPKTKTKKFLHNFSIPWFLNRFVWILPCMFLRFIHKGFTHFGLHVKKSLKGPSGGPKQWQLLKIFGSRSLDFEFVENLIFDPKLASIVHRLEKRNS